MDKKKNFFEQTAGALRILKDQQSVKKTFLRRREEKIAYHKQAGAKNLSPLL